MSCRSTPLSHAATTEAHATTPTLDDAQVQSLFHALKREGKTLGALAPSPDEYAYGIQRIRWRTRNDPSLTPSLQNAILQRLDDAEHGPLPTGELWHAVVGVRSAADVAASRLDKIVTEVAASTGDDPQHVRELLTKWRDDDHDDYEDYPAPDVDYRHDLLSGVPTDRRTARALRKLGWEQYLAEPLPVFVYGTLRIGQHNAVLYDGALDSYADGTVHGVGVYGSRNGFPYAAEHPNPAAVTVGDLIWLTDDPAGHTARRYLDGLEGFSSDDPSASHYLRVRKPIVLPAADGGTVTRTAWMYLAQGHYAERLRETDRIVHGDWVAESTAIERARRERRDNDRSA